MASVNRLLWLFVLLCVAALVVTLVHSTSEEKSEAIAEQNEDFYDEGGDNFDYESLDESEIGNLPEKQESGGASLFQHQVPLPPPPPPPPSQVAFGPANSYAEQPQYVGPTAPAYQPVPVSPSYSAPIYSDTLVTQLLQPQVSYTSSVVEQPVIFSSPPESIQPQVVYPPIVNNYTYQSAPIASNYVKPAHQLSQPISFAPKGYSTPISVHQSPVVQGVNYTSPIRHYQPVANYSQSPAGYQPLAVSYNNTISKPQVVYQQPQVALQHPQVAFRQPQQLTQPPLQHYKPQPINSPTHLAQKYSLSELAPFTTPFGYRANHWSLHYYRFNIYRNACPKQMYAHGPSQKDIEVAFAYALNQVGSLRTGLEFMNASGPPSFAARHQIFSFLSQKNARMDEEGLVVELVSQYLADRLCMTKWDRQRYLPQVTRMISASAFPPTHTCSQYHTSAWSTGQFKTCHQSRYRTYDGFCNNPYHPYWGRSNTCHIRLMSPDYADGIALPRESHNPRYPLPNPRLIANVIHSDIPLDGPYNLMKMQWGQFINHDITNTALSSYDGLVDCCKQPQTRGCWPILVPPGDKFYGGLNITCLNFIRSGVCPTCQLGPRQQTNKNTAFMDASHVYGNNLEQANQLRSFFKGQLRASSGKNGEQLLPVAHMQDQCTGTCYMAGDSRVNQHPALTALHVLMMRNHNRHAHALAQRHPEWNDETLYQEARRLNIAEYQMITFNEYLPIVFGPILSAYFQLIPQSSGFTNYNPKTDPSTWNEYTTASCRFGHSQVSSVFGLYARIGHGQPDPKLPTFRLKEWFMRPSLLADGLTSQIVNGLLARPSLSVDPWVTTDVRNHLYQSHKDRSGGDLAATNVWRGRDHGLPGYVHYLEYCFNYKVRGWRELQLFIPPLSLNQLRKLYKVVENIDLFTGGLAERHFPGADIGPTFACINGIQYNHLKFGDRFYFEHANQVGSFTPAQLDEIRRSTLARLLCHTANLHEAPQYAFLQPSMFNQLVNCSQVGDIDYSKF